jgi:general stress protein YciG
MDSEGRRDDENRPNRRGNENGGNFQNDRQRASEAGRKGGRSNQQGGNRSSYDDEM